ncbi:cyclic nucleotide-binding domain-containing protein [Desulfotignum phosphitoxidans]|uniref:Putative cyclic nucleotide-binding protein n=1 Tax=Desulfotignum phosphitoxidans DSM 13687 TaxID=1286635 RepID=S0G6F7_9BACT|nr:cyclic nucleotide-binding domain-containing protein [Desulfotignum phosphitoxidans]EMS81619.1 putative cyclic nucleotide-binding protein [Desulfotignum phosphitoxidans DSM 13687]
MRHKKGYTPMVVVMLWVLTGSSVWAVHAAAQDHGISLPAALDRVAIFSTLTDAEKQVLETAATLKKGAKGEQIIFQDTAMKQMVILLDGHASVRVNGKQVAELFGEILLGEIEFLDGPAASADVFLLSDTDYIALDNALLKKIMDDHPRLGIPGHP